MIELGPHQTKALRELDSGKILCGGVGTGKTRTSLAYFFLREADARIAVNGHGELKEARKPLDLYVITTAKKRNSLDWEKEALDFRLSTERELSHSGMKVTVDSWNNIDRYTDVKDAFFIFDEQRVVGYGAWTKSFLKIAKANRWILLSGTPGDTWHDYLPVFIANGFYRNKTEFEREHVVFSRFAKFPKVERYIGEQRLERHRRELLVDMPYDRHTTRHIKNITVQYDKEKFLTVVRDRWNPYDDKPIQEVGELFSLMRRVTNEHPSRVAGLMDVMERHPRLIVFYNFDYELDFLRTLAATVGIEAAEYNGHKHQAVPEGDRWLYIVQYTAGAEAWNCITTDAIAFFSLNYSWKIMEQCMGRIDRMNTPYTDLWYYMLRTGSPLDLGIVRALKNKKTFNERAWLKTKA